MSPFNLADLFSLRIWSSFLFPHQYLPQSIIQYISELSPQYLPQYLPICPLQYPIYHLPDYLTQYVPEYPPQQILQHSSLYLSPYIPQILLNILLK